MSSYSELRARPSPVESAKNDIDPALMALFVPSDKLTQPITMQAWVEMEGEEEDWKASHADAHYRCSVAGMKDRLELLGFTLEAAGIAFRIGIARDRYRAGQEVERYRAMLQNAPPPVLKSLPEAAKESEPHSIRVLGIHQKRVEALAQLNLEAWLQGLREVRRLGLVNQPLEAPENCDLIVEYILELGGIMWALLPAKL
jgi:hypothetical protein